MSGSANRIAHVMQTIEHRYEVVILARKLLGLRDLKGYAVRDPCTFGRLAGCLDRFVVVIESEEPRVGERFCHQYC